MRVHLPRFNRLMLTVPLILLVISTPLVTIAATTTVTSALSRTDVRIVTTGGESSAVVESPVSGARDYSCLLYTSPSPRD